MSTFVLPGDPIPLPSSSKVTLGPGISTVTPLFNPLDADRVNPAAAPQYAAAKMGVLRSGKAKDGESLWIEGKSKRYIPAQKELVLGTIIARHAEGYRVDLGSSQMASLDALAFEGATKRSKPNLKVGTLVYARVSLANRDMEPEIECVDPSTGKAEGFGELKGGLVVSASLQLCRQLLNPKFPLLPLLATHIPFETAIGLNGKVWFKTSSVSQTIAVKRIIEAVDDGSLQVDKKKIDKAVQSFLA